MRWTWWPWPRRCRQNPQVQQATEKIDQARVDRDEARKVLDEAKEISDWARKASFENRFDLRLEAAWRAKSEGER